jgi:hypothetical protein
MEKKIIIMVSVALVLLMALGAISLQKLFSAKVNVKEHELCIQGKIHKIINNDYIEVKKDANGKFIKCKSTSVITE